MMAGNTVPLEFVSPLEIRVQGPRIGLEHVVERYLEGYAIGQIAEDFPGLSEAKIDAIIGYYLSHRDEVEAYLDRLADHVDRQMREDDLADPLAVVKRLRALRAERQRSRPT
jgi:uncharacterized protein (DUF433 family)